MRVSRLVIFELNLKGKRLLQPYTYVPEEERQTMLRLYKSVNKRRL